MKQPNCIRNGTTSTYDKAAGAAKQGANEAAKVGQQAKDKASAAAGEVIIFITRIINVTIDRGVLNWIIYYLEQF